jgi:hypothetical protein
MTPNWRRNVAVLALCAFLLQITCSTATHAHEFDLSSTSTSPVQGLETGVGTPIRVGGDVRNVSGSSFVTPAEQLAINQIMATGRQSVILNSLGTAVGGNFSLSGDIPSGARGVVIPHGVTGYQNFGHQSDLIVPGALVNGGNFYLFSTNPQVSAGTLQAHSITNLENGLISSILPVSFSAGHNAVPNFSFTLSALQDIVNSGTITSSGNLTLLAGNSIHNALPPFSPAASGPVIEAAAVNLSAANIVNAGSITALAGHLTMQSLTHKLLVDGTSGTFSAGAGDIVARTQPGSGADLRLVGGNYFSNQLNLEAVDGNIKGFLGDVTGLVNLSTGCASFGASTPELNLGHLNVTGDPTYFNTTGTINITVGSIETNGADLAFLAAESIRFGSHAIGEDRHVWTKNANGDGGSVVMIAGASLTANNGAISGSDDSTTIVTVNGPSGQSGYVDLQGLSGGVSTAGSSPTGAKGGDQLYVSYTRQVSFTNTLQTVDLSGTCTDCVTPCINCGDGNFTIIAGSNNTTAIELPYQGIKTTGVVDLSIAEPVGTMVVQNGTVISGGITAGPLRLGSIGHSEHGEVLDTDGLINIRTGGGIFVGGFKSNTANINDVTFGTTFDFYGAAPKNFVGTVSGLGPSSVLKVNAPDISISGIVKAGTITMRAGTSIVLDQGGQLIAGSSMSLWTGPGGATMPQVAGTAPANATVVNLDGAIYYGTKGLETVNGTSNEIFVQGGTLTFATSFSPSDSIKLMGDNVIRVDGYGVKSLELSFDYIQVAKLVAWQQQYPDVIGGTLQTDGLFATGGNLIIRGDVNLGGLKGLMIPAGVTVTFLDRTPTNPINVSITDPNWIRAVTINGTQEFVSTTATPSNAVLNINSTTEFPVPFTFANNGITTSDGSLTINVNGNTSLGGTMTATTGNLSVATTIGANGGDGGITIGGNITSAGLSSFSVSSTSTINQLVGSTITGNSINLQAVTGAVTARNLVGTGGSVNVASGGNINLGPVTTAGGDMTVSTPNGIAQMTGNWNLDGPGTVGSANIQVGTLKVDGIAAAISANGTAGNADGGGVTVGAKTFDLQNGGSLALTANGFGAGSGGEVSLSATDNALGNVTIGPGSITLSAASGATGGNGGNISVDAAKNLTVTTSAMAANPLAANGDGAEITLKAGTGVDGNLTVNGAINATGSGTGHGGKIDLQAANGTMHINGNLQASTGSGDAGSIEVLYRDESDSFLIGGNTATSYIDGAVSADSTSGSNGSISFSSSGAELNVELVGALDSDGTVNFNGVGKPISVLNTGVLSGTVTAEGTVITLQSDDAGAPFVVGNLRAESIHVISTQSQLQVAPDSLLVAYDGDLKLQNTNTGSGAIHLGANSTVRAYSLNAGEGKVYVVVGSIPPSLEAGPVVPNLTKVIEGTGNIYLGQNGITSNGAGGNLVKANNSDVIFDTGTLSASAITLDGGVQVKATSGQLVLGSLDLTDPAVLAQIEEWQQLGLSSIGGNLAVSGGIAVGGNIILQSVNIGGLSSANIPSGVTVTLMEFQSGQPISISLTPSSYSPTVNVNGTLEFISSGNSNAILNITSTSGANPVLLMGSTGSLTSDGSLSLNIGGNVHSSGTVEAQLGNLSVVTTPGSNGDITIAAGTFSASAITTLTTDGTGEILSPGTGLLIGTTVNLSTQSAVGSASTAFTTQASNLSITTDNDVFISNTGDLSLTAPSLYGQFHLTNSGNLTVAGNLTADDVFFESALLQQNGGTITADSLNLVGGAASQGTAVAPLITSIDVLNADTNGSVYLTNDKALALGAIDVGSLTISTAGTGAVTQLPATLVKANSLSIAASSVTLLAANQISAIQMTLSGSANIRNQIAMSMNSTVIDGALTIESPATLTVVSTVDAGSIDLLVPGMVLFDLLRSNTGDINIQSNGVASSLPIYFGAVSSGGQFIAEVGDVNLNPTTPGAVTITAFSNGTSLAGRIRVSTPGSQINFNGGTSPISITMADIEGDSNIIGSDITIWHHNHLSNANITASGDVDLTSKVFSANNVTAAGKLSITSYTDLTFNGTSQYSSLSSIFVDAGSGNITINGTQDFSAPSTSIEALGRTVTASGLAQANADGDLTVTAASIANPNGFSATGNLRLNIGSPTTSMGTILNSDGDVILTKNMFINTFGKSLAIIALGNVLADGLTTINLSNTKGNAGNLVVMAGVDSDQYFGPPELQKTDITNVYTVTEPSPTGGDINFDKVAVITSSTGLGNDSGSVHMFANAGTEAAGVIVVGGINTSSAADRAGSVKLIGTGGVYVNGSIVTSGLNRSGDVQLIGGTPVLVDPVQIWYGFGSNTNKVTAVPTSGSGAGVMVNGAITTSSKLGTSGNVEVAGAARVFVNGAVTTSGLLSSGHVNISSLDGEVLLANNVVTSGLNRTATQPGVNAANGGTVAISAPNYITIKGFVNSHGGTAFGAAPGGDGGNVSIVATSPNHVGNVSIARFVNAVGGDSSLTAIGSAGGDGGNVVIDGGSVKILGAASVQGTSASVITSGGRATTRGAHGSISVTTHATQTIPSNFDLMSATASEIVLPGALFTIGKSPVVNGTANKLVSGTDMVDASFGAITNTATDGIVSVNVTDGGWVGSVPAFVDAKGVRLKMTPARALGFYQQSTGLTQTINTDATGRLAAGSTITIPESDLPASFSKFVLGNSLGTANNLQISIIGQHPLLNLSTAPTVLLSGATLNFPTPNSMPLINVGAKAFTLPSNSTINTDGMLVLGAAGKFTLFGNANADDVVFLNASGKNTAFTADNLSANPIENVLIAIESMPLTMTVKGNIDHALMQDLILPSGYGTVATSTLPKGTKPTQVVLNAGSDLAIRRELHTKGLLKLNVSGHLDADGPVELISEAGNIDLTAQTARINIGPFRAAGQIKVIGKDGLTVNGWVISGKGMLLDSGTGPLICGENVAVQFVNAGGILRLNSLDSIHIEGSLSSGTFKNYPGGIVRPEYVQSAGSISITGYNIGFEDLELDTRAGDINLAAGDGGIFFSRPDYVTSSAGAWFDAIGGSISIRSSGSIDSRFELYWGGVNLTARGRLVGTKEYGGGVEILAGTLVSQLPKTVLGPVAYPVIPVPPAIPPSLQPAGTILWLYNTPGYGPFVYGNGYFCANVYNNELIQLSNVNIVVQRESPISHVTGEGRPRIQGMLEHTTELADDIVCSGGDAVLLQPSSNATIEIEGAIIKMKKNSLVAISMQEALRVVNCGNLGEVEIVIGGRVIPIHPGQEARLGASSVTTNLLQDGVGRRGFAKHMLPGGKHLSFSEISLTSMLTQHEYLAIIARPRTSAERNIANRFLKTAAALTMTTQHRGAFSALPKARSGTATYKPVSYEGAGSQ